jgi:hypothetical protein
MSSRSNNAVIDLSNDSPERSRRRHGSVMDDGRNYSDVRQGRAAAARPQVIDLVNEPSSPRTSDSKPSSRAFTPYAQSSRQSSPPSKRKRTESNATTSAAAMPISQRSADGGVITHNVLNLIDQFRNQNTLTINGNTTQSTPRNVKNPKQPFHYTQEDTWSCGFRNLQMLISAMPPSFQSIFPNGVPPLNEFQSSFEILWAEGFDPTGAHHHDSKMVGKSGKVSWIGAVEVWSYLSFRGIDATIVQFAKNMENRSCIGSFVWAYFSRLGPECDCQASNSRMTSYQYAQELVQTAKQIHGSAEETPSLITCSCTLLPLYLQWAGHSVTIVGIRRERIITSNGSASIRYHLIVFDPQKDGGMLRNKLTNELSKSGQRQRNCLNFMELSTERLLNKDTQVLLSTARIISDHERERCKERVSCISVTV